MLKALLNLIFPRRQLPQKTRPQNPITAPSSAGIKPPSKPVASANLIDAALGGVTISAQPHPNAGRTQVDPAGISPAKSATRIVNPFELKLRGDQETKQLALRMMNDVIKDLSNLLEERETVSILKISKRQFEEKGEIYDYGPPAKACVDIAIGLHTIPPSFRCCDAYPSFFKGVIIPASKYWNNPDIKILVGSLFLKEGYHVVKGLKLSKDSTNKIRADYDLLKYTTGEDMPQHIDPVSLARKFQDNATAIKLAKKLIATQVHGEYLAFKKQLEFLFRRGFNSSNVEEKRRQIKALNENGLISIYMNATSYLDCISQEGEINETKLKASFLCGFLKTIDQLMPNSSMALATRLISHSQLEFLCDPKYYDPY